MPYRSILRNCTDGESKHRDAAEVTDAIRAALATSDSYRGHMVYSTSNVEGLICRFLTPGHRTETCRPTFSTRSFCIGASKIRRSLPRFPSSQAARPMERHTSSPWGGAAQCDGVGRGHLHLHTRGGDHFERRRQSGARSDVHAERCDGLHHGDSERPGHGRGRRSSVPPDSLRIDSLP